jgi:3-dehydroquinate dehydratase/shikimate dehydrogenase
MTRLCVPIFVTDLAEARRDIAAAAAAGADLVELRIDRLNDLAVVTLLLADRVLPAIVTCRSVSEGGFSRLSDSQRMAILARALADGAENVDLEFQSAASYPPDFSSRLILSVHDFSKMPGNLDRIFADTNAKPAAVTKVVWQAHTICENLQALKLLSNPPRPIIALCMGEAGLISRVLAKKFGAYLTFASLNAEGATAPGQVTIADIKNLYRWDAINAHTKVFGVVGRPVKHSMSPAIHNASFGAVGFDGIYLPMLVDPDYQSFRLFLDDFLNFPGMDLSGLSITIPHKENALRYLTERGAQIEELGRRIGAINTIVIEHAAKGPPKLSGMNTDYAAILDSITAELKIDHDHLADLRVSILGAGGTARAAVAGLAHFGANILIANRTPERAQALAEEFNNHRGKVAAVPFEVLCKSECDVFINTTSVGMYPKTDENPLADANPNFSDKTLVFDLIYNPMKTNLLTQAEGLGANTISGVEMFIRQAVAQFEAWTKMPAPHSVMRQVISDRLGLPLHSK